VATHEDLIRPQVITAVEDLVSRKASGVLEVTGSPSGAIYLDGGRIVFARAPWVPGLAARLRGIRPSLAGLEALPSGREADDAAIAGFVLQRGYLTMTALHELVQSIVVDAFLVLTVPQAMDAPVTAIRFNSTRTYWTEVFPRFGLGLVRGEALRMAEWMGEYGLTPTTAVAPCALREPAAVLTREQWALACQIGEHASARDLAARRGAALIGTLECLGSLTRSGLCAPVRVGGRRQPPAPAPGVAHSTGPSAGPPPASLPARRSAQDYPTRAERLPGGLGGLVGPSDAPTADILRQVLNGLKKLS
jgi:hypothetical protein